MSLPPIDFQVNRDDFRDTRFVPGAAIETPQPRRQLAVELAVIIGIAVLLAVVLRTFVTQTYAISGDSMNPTLEDGEWSNDRRVFDPANVPDTILWIELVADGVGGL